MAKVTLSPHLEDLRGKVGNFVFRRTASGKLTLIKLADMSNVKWSEAQKANRARFKEAVAYARTAMAEPKVRAKYEKAATKQNKRPIDLAVSDYLKGNNLLAPKQK